MQAAADPDPDPDPDPNCSQHVRAVPMWVKRVRCGFVMGSMVAQTVFAHMGPERDLPVCKAGPNIAIYMRPRISVEGSHSLKNANNTQTICSRGCFEFCHIFHLHSSHCPPSYTLFHNKAEIHSFRGHRNVV